jgi:hypothetical protein
LARDKIDGAPRVWVVQNPKIKIFLVRKELAAVKNNRRIYELFGTFLLFCRNDIKSKLRLLGAVTAQAK